jgi:DNA-binding IclR family transcriptional regulator
MSENRDYFVPAVMRAMDILEFLGENREASFEKIYTQTGIPKSSTYQLLLTLESRGYLRRVGEGKRYALGLRLFELGNLAVSHLNIRAEAMPILQDLMEKTNSTCHLGIIEGTEGVYLAKIEGTQGVLINSWEGKRIAFHSTSMGKVLLAWRDEKSIDEILGQGQLAAFTENTMTDRQKFKQHLQMVNKRGWALDDQENEPDIRCIAAPVRHITGAVIAAVSISSLATRLNDAVLPEISQAVMQAAIQLSAKLGGSSESHLKKTG